MRLFKKIFHQLFNREVASYLHGIGASIAATRADVRMLRIEVNQLLATLRKDLKMSMDKLTQDVQALIDEAVKDVKAAVAAAQSQSNDPAIDALDAKVNDAMKNLQDTFATMPKPDSGASTPSADTSSIGSGTRPTLPGQQA